MTSYLRYKQQIRTVQDADDAEIESWITVRGNHIPIRKGQSKEEAVKSFIEHQAGKNDLPQGTKWSPTNTKGEGTGNKPSQKKEKYNIQHGAKISDIESMINKHADKKGYKSWKEEEEHIAEKLKEEGIYAYGSQIKEAMKNVYGDVYTQERKEEGSNASGKFEVVGGSGIKHKTFETQAEAEKWAKENINKTHTSLKVVSGYKKYKEYEPKKYVKQEYDPEFETVRKNAKANPNLYGGKYTQKSKAEAYKEYKKDTLVLKDPKTGKEIVANLSDIKSDDNVMPSATEYGKYLDTITSKTGISREDARKKYGQYTTAQWNDLLSHKEYKKDTAPKMRIGLPEGKEGKEIIDRVLKDFRNNYDKLYKDNKLDSQYGDLVTKFDKDMQESPEFKEFVQKVVKQRGDVFSSDREVKALMLAANEYGLVVGNKEKTSQPKQPADIMDWKFEDVMKLPVSDPRVHKYIAKNNWLKESTVSTIAEAFGSTEDLYMEIDRMSNAKGYGWDKIKWGKK